MLKLRNPGKTLLKKVIFLLLYKLYFQRRKDSKGLIVLTYHRIANEPDLDDPLKVSLSTFEQQILYLKRNFRIISGEELAAIIKREGPFPENACLITFDDGWKDNYTNAFPILKRYGVPAILFVPTDYVGTDRVFWHEQLTLALMSFSNNIDMRRVKDRFSRWPKSVLKKIELITTHPQHLRRPTVNDLIEYLKCFGEEKNISLAQELDALLFDGKREKPPSMLSWEEILEMSKDNIQIGSHGKTHCLLTQIDEGRVRAELTESKNIIEKRIERPVNFLAYPNGNYNEGIKKLARRVGYLACFTCQTGINQDRPDPFELKRKNVLEELSLGMNGQYSELFFKAELCGGRAYVKRLISKGGQANAK